jgi:hypothetical protein
MNLKAVMSVSALAAACACPTLAHAQGAVYACVRNTTMAVRIIAIGAEPSGWPAQCHASPAWRAETPAVGAAQGPQGPTGATGATGPAGPALRVVDSLDQEVGLYLPVVAGFPYDGVARNIGGRTVAYLMNRSGFIGSGGVFFTTADCSGTPHITAFGGLLSLGEIYFGNMYYPTGDAVDVQALSVLESDRCLQQSNFLTLHPAAGVAISTLGLVPPFRVTQ